MKNISFIFNSEVFASIVKEQGHSFQILSPTNIPRQSFKVLLCTIGGVQLFSADQWQAKG